MNPENGNKIRNARRNLKRFKEMIELIKTYPTSLMLESIKLPYEIPKNEILLVTSN